MAFSTLRRTKGLRPRSVKREREDAERQAMLIERYGPSGSRICRYWHYLEAAWIGEKIARDEYDELRKMRCFGEVHGHELKKSSQGGSRKDPANVIPLCDFHNGWVENSPELAHRLELVKWRSDV